MSQAAEEATPLPAPMAWQPFTFGGVASFARAGWGWLVGAQFLTALLISASVVGFIRHAYAPVILQAMQKMPDTVRIVGGRLVGIDATLLTETKFLAIAVNPFASNQIGQSADVQVQMRQVDFTVGAVFRPDWGWAFDYGPTLDLDLSDSHLESWWGAWHPIIFAVAGVGTMAGMFVLWGVVAVIYTVPAKFVAWVGNRQLSWCGAWRLAAAALLPGGLLVALGIVLYGWGAMDLLGLGFIYLTHLLSGWVYLVGGAVACPRISPGLGKYNPFNS